MSFSLELKKKILNHKNIFVSHSTYIRTILITKYHLFVFSGESHICEANIVPIYDCFLKALEDYTHDRRGDVGAWVREAAMSGLASLTLALAEASPKLVPEVCMAATMPKIG